MPEPYLLEQPSESAPPAASRATAPAANRAVRIRGRDALLAACQAAGECDAAAASPIDGLDWVAAALATVDAGRALDAVAIERGQRVVALAPLVVARSGGIKRRVLSGVGELGEPMDLPCVDEAARAALVQALVRDRRPLWLERVAADSPTLALLHAAAGKRGRLVVRPQAPCPSIELSDAWRDPLSQLNAGRRSDLRRARRKAEALGALATEILAPALDEVDALVALAIDIERRSWKGPAGTALAADPRRTAFYRDYARRAAAAGQLRLCFWSIGGRRVAMQIAVQRGDGFWLLKVGYDEQFAPCSPGQWLLSETIRYAAEQGLTRYEFLGRAEQWTRVWTQSERATVSVRFYPRSLGAAAALAADGLAIGWHKLRRRPATADEP